MDCSTARELLEEYFEGTLPTRRRTEVSAHVSECAGCAEELAQIEKVASALSAAPLVEPSVEVLRAITKRAATLPAPGARRALVSGWQRVAVLGAACVAVLAGSRYGLPLAWPNGGLPYGLWDLNGEWITTSSCPEHPIGRRSTDSEIRPQRHCCLDTIPWSWIATADRDSK